MAAEPQKSRSSARCRWIWLRAFGAGGLCGKLKTIRSSGVNHQRTQKLHVRQRRSEPRRHGSRASQLRQRRAGSARLARPPARTRRKERDAASLRKRRFERQ